MFDSAGRAPFAVGIVAEVVGFVAATVYSTSRKTIPVFGRPTALDEACEDAIAGKDHGEETGAMADEFRGPS